MIKEKLHDTKKNKRDLFLTQIAISQKQGVQFESASNVGAAHQATLRSIILFAMKAITVTSLD